MTEETFKTLLPKKSYDFRQILKEHPFRGEECAGCRWAPVCENGSEGLPLMVLNTAQMYEPVTCRFGTEMALYSVIHFVGDAGDEPSTKYGPVVDESERDMYLVDANVFINAIQTPGMRGRISRWVLENPNLKIATTYQVLREVHNMPEEMRKSLILFRVRRVDPVVESVKPQYGKKEASGPDKSLIQAAIDHEEVKGIITFDRDFKNIATTGLIQVKMGRKVDVLTPHELKKKIVKPKH